MNRLEEYCKEGVLTEEKAVEIGKNNFWNGRGLVMGREILGAES